MPRTREEWAIAIARRFFIDDLGDTQVHVHVTPDILSEIAQERDWGLDTPDEALEDLRQAAEENQNIFTQEYAQAGTVLVANRGDWLDGLPLALADFALAMVAASDNWRNMDHFVARFNELFNADDIGEPPFKSGGIGGNLKRFCERMSQWSAYNQGRGNFVYTDVWGPWWYITKFYQQLAFSEGDKDKAREVIRELVQKALDEGTELAELPHSASFHESVIEQAPRFQGRLQEWLRGGTGGVQADALQDSALAAFDSELGRGLRGKWLMTASQERGRRPPRRPALRPLISVVQLGFDDLLRVRFVPTDDEVESAVVRCLSSQYPSNEDITDEDSVAEILDALRTRGQISAWSEDGADLELRKGADWPTILMVDRGGVLVPAEEGINEGDMFAVLLLHKSTPSSVATKAMLRRLCTSGGNESEVCGYPLFRGLVRSPAQGQTTDPRLLRFSHRTGLVGGIPHVPHGTTFHPFAQPTLSVRHGPLQRLDGSPRTEKAGPRVVLTQEMSDTNGNPLPEVRREVSVLALPITSVSESTPHVEYDRFGRIAEDGVGAFTGLQPAAPPDAGVFEAESLDSSSGIEQLLERHHIGMRLRRRDSSLSDTIGYCTVLEEAEPGAATDHIGAITHRIATSNGRQLLDALQRNPGMPNNIRPLILWTLDRKLQQRVGHMMKMHLIDDLVAQGATLPERHAINVITYSSGRSDRFRVWNGDLDFILASGSGNIGEAYGYEDAIGRLIGYLNEEDWPDASEFDMERVRLECRLGVNRPENIAALGTIASDAGMLRDAAGLLEDHLLPAGTLHEEMRRQIEDGLFDTAVLSAVRAGESRELLEAINYISGLTGNPPLSKPEEYEGIVRGCEAFRDNLSLGFTRNLRLQIDSGDLWTDRTPWEASVGAIEGMHRYARPEHLDYADRLVGIAEQVHELPRTILLRINAAMETYKRRASQVGFCEATGTRLVDDVDDVDGLLLAELNRLNRTILWGVRPSGMPNCNQSGGPCQLDFYRHNDIEDTNGKGYLIYPAIRTGLSRADLQQKGFLVRQRGGRFHLRCSHGGRAPIVWDHPDSKVDE